MKILKLLAIVLLPLFLSCSSRSRNLEDLVFLDPQSGNAYNFSFLSPTQGILAHVYETEFGDECRNIPFTYESFNDEKDILILALEDELEFPLLSTRSRIIFIDVKKIFLSHDIDELKSLGATIKGCKSKDLTANDNLEEFAEDEVNDNSEKEEDINSEIISFLHYLHTDPSAKSQIEADWWIRQYCTERMQKKLIDEYPYDTEPGQECYAIWIIGGWDSESSGIFQKITNDSDYFYVHLAADPESGAWKGVRVLRYKILSENNSFKIDDCEWIEDFEWANDD